MRDERMRQLEREKSLIRYNAALEAADFETVAAILLEAEADSQLAQMILEVNDLVADEADTVAQAEDRALVRDLLLTYLPSGQPETAPEPPLLTVGHVLARIHADAALRGQVEQAALAATRSHQMADRPLPADLSIRRVNQLLKELGVQVSRRFETLFRETALLMRMGRNQGMARLAATRLQEQRPRYMARAPLMYSMVPPDNVRQDEGAQPDTEQPDQKQPDEGKP